MAASKHGDVFHRLSRAFAGLHQREHRYVHGHKTRDDEQLWVHALQCLVIKND
jgi:hypothetical protein